MQYENNFKTQDFYSAVSIIASGYQLIELNHKTGKTLEFVISVDSETANTLIQKHWNRTLRIPSRDLVDAINELKTRMYDRSTYVT